MHLRTFACCSLLLILISHAEGYRRPRRPHRNKPLRKTLHARSRVPKTKKLDRILNLPNLLPLVFKNSISVLQPIQGGYILRSLEKQEVVIGGVRRKSAGPTSTVRQYSAFTITKHDKDFFPVSMRGVTVVIGIRNSFPSFSYLHMWLMIPRGPNNRSNVAKFLFSRGLLQNMLDNAQKTLGSVHCHLLYRTFSGVCNNPSESLRHSGVTDAPLRASGIFPGFSPAETGAMEFTSAMPSARLVSNKIMTASSLPDQKAPQGANMLFVAFGQLLDHDITFTPVSSGPLQQLAPIEMPEGDMTEVSMRFVRSDTLREVLLSRTPTASLTGKPYNAITSFIDGSFIYGSDNVRANVLRSFTDGKLRMRKVHGAGYLPRNSPEDVLVTLNNDPDSKNRDMALSGDVRVNEHPILTALHTLFAREHNRVCDVLIESLEERSQSRSDHWLFLNARRITIAEMQNIVFQEFVPTLLGSNALGAYRGYSQRVDASMSVFHSTAAYRWGHSAITDSVTVSGNKLLFTDLFFSPKLLPKYGIENWLLGAMREQSNAVDAQIAHSLRNKLFRPEANTVLDLAALNIQRGRDHGLPSYTQASTLYGTATAEELGLGNIPAGLRLALLEVYGSAHKIDAFVGGLAETAVKGSLLGPLFHAANVDQFKRLRDGDRFYYENLVWRGFLGNLPIVRNIMEHKVRLTDVIFANTNLKDADLPNPREAFKSFS